MSPDCKMCIVMLGEMGVGKTSLLLRFTKQIFKETLANTIVDCHHTELTVADKHVHLQLWDTAGQERFKTLVKNYFRKADGVLLVYDVTDITSFHKLSSWLLELRDSNEKAVTLIVGNKIDDPSKKAVAVNIVKRFAEEEKLEFLESSAKSGENVNEIFEHLTRKVLEAKGIIKTSAPQSEEGEPSKEVAESAEPVSVIYTCTQEEPESIRLHESRPVVAVQKKKKCC